MKFNDEFIKAIFFVTIRKKKFKAEKSSLFLSSNLMQTKKALICIYNFI